MIYLTRLDGKEMVVNDDHILYVESIPDTMVTLTTGAHFMVKEAVGEVIARTAAYRHRIFKGPEEGPQPKSTVGEL